MKTIKVLGGGCKSCRVTADNIEAIAARLGVAVEVEKVEDFARIASFGVMSTPSVVVDGALVHTGGVPSTAQIEGWVR